MLIILRKINEFHISILKGYFRRRIKRKINWNCKSTIIVGLFYTTFQVFERIYTKIKFHNCIALSFFFISSFASLLMLFLFIPFLYFVKDEKNEEIKKLYSSNDETLFQNELSYYHFSHNYEIKTSNPIVDFYFDNIIIEKLENLALISLKVRNAGGKSEISEAYSINHISKIKNSNICFYERDIRYWCEFKMLDYILVNENGKIGVSVVRAFSKRNEFTYEKGLLLLQRKISGLLIAKRIVSEIFHFDTTILHIICENEEIKNILISCFSDEKLSKKSLSIDINLCIWISISSIRSIFTNKFQISSDSFNSSIV